MENRLKQSAELRSRAEETLLKKAAQAPEHFKAESPEKMYQMLHELQVHQIELEMQNEELREAQVELDVVRKRYFNLYDLAPVGYCTISAEGLILEANLTAATMFGVPRKKLANQHLNKFIHKEDQDAFYLHCRQLFKSSKRLVCELRMLHQDGKVRWARLESNLPHDAESLPTCRMVLSDITEQKNTEDILRKSNENYHRIFENQMIAICIYDSETLQIIDVNAHFTQLYGHSREELLGCMRFTDMSAEPEISTELNLLEKSKIFFNPLRFHKKKDGTIFPVEIFGEAYLRDGRQVMLIMVRDITQRKRAENELSIIHAELERKVLERTAELEKTNATLAMMLDFGRKTETDIQERVVSNLRTNIMSIVDIVKKQQLTKSTQDLIELLEITTRNLAHPLARNLESQLLKLTAREMQLANLIRLGKSNKELMVLLNLSANTVGTHRNNLRKKLGLRHKKINLRTYLNTQIVE